MPHPVRSHPARLLRNPNCPFATLLTASLGAVASESGTSAWLAGPIVGAIGGAALLFGGVAYFYRRHRPRRTVDVVEPLALEPDDLAVAFDKAQLHSECMPRPVPQELEGSFPAPVSELNVNEVPAHEMPVDDEDATPCRGSAAK
jgi:hypothetical protein